MRGRNLSLDLFQERLPAASLFISSDQEEEERENRKRLIRTLQKAMEGELTQRQKDCLRFYYFEGFSQEEIAQEMGITAATVSRHLKKARNRLGRVIGYAYPSLGKNI